MQVDMLSSSIHNNTNDVSRENRTVTESGTGSRGIIARAREIAMTASMRKNDTDRKFNKESNRPAQRRASLDSGLGVSSYHSSGVANVPSKVRRGLPSRHVSSDNIEAGTSNARRDELATATLHGSTNVSRVRSKKHIEKEVTKNTKNVKDRRSHMKRAMSRENVKPPEEYGPNSQSVVAPSSSTKSPAGLYGSSPEPRRGRRKPVKEESYEEDEANEQIVDPSEVESESEDSFAEEDHEGTALHNPIDIQRKKSTPIRRDLISLLRDQKTVHVSDMKDRDNRRILHFLIYQQSLNIDLTELQASVDHDIAINGAAALRRPTLPLYVEPAN
jgi:hypothetical protein